MRPDPKYCRSCNEWVASLHTHYDLVHRKSVTIRYHDDDTPYTIHRDPQDGTFECIKCKGRYRHARSVRRHGDDGCPEHFKHLGTVRISSQHRAKSPKDAAATPKNLHSLRCQHRGQRASGRTKPALAKSHAIPDVAERLADVDHSDLDVGHTIHIKSDDEIEVVRMSGITGNVSTAGVPRYRNHRQLSIRQHELGRTRGSLDEIRGASAPGSSRTPAGSSRNPASRGDRPLLTQTIRTFLNGLKPKLGALTNAFAELGVKTEEDLNTLCVMDHRWKEVESFLTLKGMTKLQWWALVDAFKQRASSSVAM